MKKIISTKTGIIILLALVTVIGGYTNFMAQYSPIPSTPSISPPTPSPLLPSLLDGVEKFDSEEEFKAYLQESELLSLGVFGMGAGIGGARLPMMEGLEIDAPLKGQVGVPERISETTVQVLGIDEPDVVKTDGKEIYFSSGQSYYWRRSIDIMPPKISGETKIIKAFPPADLEIGAKIDKRGDLLLHKNILIIFSGDKIYGYNVADPKNPEEKWTMKLEDRNYIVAARLYQDKVYLITQTRIDTFHPCPIRPLSVNGTSLEVKCVDIYHPIVKVPVDTTYSAVVFDPISGKTENNISFVGTSNSSVVYMSENAIYITYSYHERIVKFFSDFFKEKGQDIISEWVIEKLDKLESYDISETAKFTEFTIILERYYSSLNDDERLRIENELTNRMEDYYKEHKRELETTGIVKISLEDFDIKANGNVPGVPLNQFSLDEYQEHLRIAINVGERIFGWRWGIGGASASANDVYVLDKDLKITGALYDLGLEERIYSARFIEDKGYLVTFRQIDPFYVLDLSNPKNPQLKGELKIPGYSSYLHPISKDKILGVGKEGSKIKISLFDVKSPENPTEVSKYTLEEYWSDILNTHHAFLLDKKHQIFFLPGGRGGYIFSYQDDKLELTKAVSNIRARRAVYINDYLYIIGDDKMVVLNELDWERIGELEF